MNAADVTSALRSGGAYVNLAAVLAGDTLTDKQSAVVKLLVAGASILADSIEQQTDIDEVSWSQLDAQEVLIVAADAKEQADAAAREQADAALRAGGG